MEVSDTLYVLEPSRNPYPPVSDLHQGWLYLLLLPRRVERE